MSYAFSSPLLVELISKIKELKLESPAQKWASDIENKYTVALIDHPCTDLSEDEYAQANSYIDHIKKDFGLDLIKTFPKPEGDPFLSAAKELLATMPIEPNQEPWIEDVPMLEAQRWEDFLRASGANVSFEDWSAISSAFRRTDDRKELVLPSVKGGVKSYLNLLPKEWYNKLNLILPTTDLSEVVTTYKGTDITRGDIATVLPTSTVQGAWPTGWLNHTVIETFLRIIAAARSPDISIIVVNSYMVMELKATDIKSSAKKAGIEATTISAIDTILFPLHVRNHWQLVVAFPRTRSLILYDSLRSGQQKQLEAVRDWLKEAIGEAKDVVWDLQEKVCPQQTANSQCGVFVCIDALAVTFGKEPLGWYSPEDDANLRQYVAAVICKGRFPFDE